MEIDVIQTQSARRPTNSHGIVDISDVPASEVSDFAAEKNVYLERRGGRTYLVPA